MANEENLLGKQIILYVSSLATDHLRGNSMLLCKICLSLPLSVCLSVSLSFSLSLMGSELQFKGWPTCLL